jgi:hypothetical protein
MKIKQYNFIRGEVNSGKSTVTRKLVSAIGRDCLYFNLDRHAGFIKSQKIWEISMQRPSYQSILNTISRLNKSIDVVIDPLSRLYSSGSFTEFLQVLPSNNRYFFIDTMKTPFQYDSNSVKMEISSYDLSYHIPSKSISVFDVYKRGEDFCLYGLNTMEEYCVGNFAQIFRDSKINEILYGEEKIKS